MDAWISALWNKNKIVFFLLLPIVVLYFCRNIIISLLVNSARKVSNEAKKQDEKLKDEQVDLNNKADNLRDNANSPKDTAEKDEEWYKR